MSTAQEIAVKNLIDTWGISMPYFETGPHLNCTETNALAEFLQAFGANDAAEQLLDGHVTSDENGDNPEHLKRRDDYFAAQNAK